MRLHLQTANLLGSRLRQPRQDGARRIGLDHLLGRPKPVCRRCGIDPDHLVRRKTQLRQASYMGLFRRCHQIKAASFAGKGWNGWPKKSPFADGRLRCQKLRQTSGGPTAPGQLRIQHRKAGGNRGWIFATQLRAAPQSFCHMGRQRSGRKGAEVLTHRLVGQIASTFRERKRG